MFFMKPDSLSLKHGSYTMHSASSRPIGIIDVASYLRKEDNYNIQSSFGRQKIVWWYYSFTTASRSSNSKQEQQQQQHQQPRSSGGFGNSNPAHEDAFVSLPIFFMVPVFLFIVVGCQMMMMIMVMVVVGLCIFLCDAEQEPRNINY